MIKNTYFKINVLCIFDRSTQILEQFYLRLKK